MKILTAVNTDGDYWELNVDGDANAAFMKCDRVLTRFRHDRPADCGSAVVLWTMRDTLRVDGRGTGFLPIAGHILERVSTCECVCHRRE